MWAYIRERDLPYNALHDRGYPSIGCAPCTRAVEPGENERAGRWWWEQGTDSECGIHFDPRSGKMMRTRDAGVVGPFDELPPASGPSMIPTIERHGISHLAEIESEAIHIFREAAAVFESPALLFSGGKDSIVLLRLAEKAFRPGGFPFPIVHVDTGHNFPEALEFRDRRVAELGERLIVASVQASIDAGRVTEEPGHDPSRNRLQTTTLLDAIDEHGFDALFGGGRRDEEKARAKERIFSHRDALGGWDPRNQRPELWSLYNGRIHKGEHMRVFPISNWTELDVWQYIAAEQLEVPSIYFAHERTVVRRDGMWLAVSDVVHPLDGEEVVTRVVRYRTVGDMSCTGAVMSDGRVRSTRSSPRSPPPGSPSAARRAPTTPSPRPRWKTASARATSDGARDRLPAPGPPAVPGLGPAAVLDRRLRRRRQEHADRPPAARLEGHLRGPARRARARDAGAAAATGSISRC